MLNHRYLLSLALATSIFTFASAQSDPTKAIRAYYAMDDALAMKLDFAGLKNLKLANSTGDFVSVLKMGNTGKMVTKTRADEFAQMDSFSKMIASISKSSTHIDHLKVAKSQIVVTVTSSGELKTKKLAQDGKVHTLANSSTSEDTWIKVAGTWKMKQSKMLTSKMVVDGRALPGG